MNIFYKCRLCKEEYYQEGGEEKPITLALQIAIGEIDQKEWVLKKYIGMPPLKDKTIHFCKNGNIGIADIIGARKD